MAGRLASAPQQSDGIWTVTSVVTEPCGKKWATTKEADGAAQQRIAAAVQAQSSADQATISANRADAQAQIATAVGVADATAVSMLNKRVSELDDYKNEFQVDVFFARDSAVLDERAKKDLDNLADIAKSMDGYLIEIAGYSSNTLNKEADQKLSEERQHLHYTQLA